MRLITFLLFFMFSLSRVFCAEPGKTDVLEKGDIVPDFKIELDNDSLLSFSDYKGKTVLVVFFATWCEPCLQELPLIEKEIWKKYKDNKNFRLLVIARGHSKDEVIKFREKTKYTFPIAHDKSKAVYNKFALQYIPRSYLINGNGKIIRATKGFEERQFKKLLKQINREISKS